MSGVSGLSLIISGSTGIAAETARLAAASGARVVIATADEQSGLELAAETGAECWVGDLARPQSADSVVALCLSKFARVDGLFNAAGLSGRRFGDGPVHECTDEGWDLTIRQNLSTPFRMGRAVIGRMLVQDLRENGTRGTIVNLGSVLAEAPEPRHFAMHAYAAAKGAVVAMSRSMAAYYAAQKIRVNVVAPGLVRTAVSERSQVGSELPDFLEKKQPLSGGMVDAVAVARAALFLLGDESIATTGEVLRVDGGWSVSGV